MSGAPPLRGLAVASGKGGVGKSTVSLNLALALHERGVRVGLLDADLYGPDIPRMVNLKRAEPAARWELWHRRGLRLEPVERFGIPIMSVGFILGEQQVFPGAGPTIAPVLRQFLVDVDWGDCELLVIDLPPGTADVQQELIGLVPLAGALIVVTPQDVAHLDARKVLTLLRDRDVPVLGGVENMAPFPCPHCGDAVELFPRASDGRAVWADGVERLSSVPFDPGSAADAERGVPLLVARPESAPAEAFRALAARVSDGL